MVKIQLDQPLVSFTFDDFPTSAYEVAGRMLENAGARGTYFLSLGLTGKIAPTGQIITTDSLPSILSAGHEVGCHTFDHYPAWETRSADYLASVERNRRAYHLLSPAYQLQTHSFPINFPRPTTKRELLKRFRACRGGGQCHHQNEVDLGNLKSFFIEQSRQDPSQIKTSIDHNMRDRGWLILSTHDVSATPTPYGCTPALFGTLLNWSQASGAKIVTVAQALDIIGAPRLGEPASR